MSGKTRVLYIEDDVGSQRLVQRVLENHNYDVLLASEGLQGISLARRRSPSLILMDIRLPGMNGREVTTRLRALPDLSQVPIVALTAYDEPGYRALALAAGCNGFLTKPIDTAQFPADVSAYLSGRREKLSDGERLAHLQVYTQHLVTRLEGKIHELEEANWQLRQLDEMKNHFLGLVSHELRTPLTLLEGYAFLLEEHLARGEEGAYPQHLVNLVRGMDGGVKRVSGVIQELLDISRIASGSLELSMGPVRVGALVDDVKTQHHHTLAERNLTLRVEPLEQWPVLEADGVQLHHALSNVVENAIKYTPDGEEITIAVRDLDGAVDIVVMDNGIGIPPAEQRRIFDKFYALEALEHHSTSKKAFLGGGLGLGLAIAKGIIEAHGGRIWVESPRREHDTLPGSTFHLLLPRKQASPAGAFAPRNGS